MSPAWRPAAPDVLAALREDYEISAHSVGWALLPEVPAGGPANPRRLDALLVDTTRPPYERIAVEVKTSLADYRNDTDAKRAPAEALAHRTVYATPAGLLTPEALPPGWGLLEVAPGHWPDGRRVRHTAAAALRVPTVDVTELLAVIAGKASRALERLRAADGPDAVERAAALALRVEELDAALANARAATTRERERAAVLLARYLAGTPQTCADCGAPIRPAWGREPWAHTDARTERACLTARAQARAAAKAQVTGAAYLAVEARAPRVEATAERAERALEGWERRLA